MSAAVRGAGCLSVARLSNAVPYKDPTAERLATRDRVRRHRERKRANAALPSGDYPADPVGALSEWARANLKIPPGHPLAGQPMALPDFAESFIRDGWAAHESALCCGRKNAKSAICAVLILGFLVGPLRRPGWRGAVASISQDKAAELRRQVVEIAEASGLTDLRIRRSPYPGSIEGPEGASFDTLSADRGAGHASGFDLVLVDECGLLPERYRDLLAGLRSSVSARAGRVVHLSIRGDSPLYAEILKNPATVAHVYAAADDCDLDDRDAWAAANPGLGSIKQISYMAAEVERIKGAPGDEPSFRAYDLNQPLDPSAEMICEISDLRRCFVEDPPPRSGDCFVGFDFGEATSGTAAAAIWPETGRVETWLAFGDKPSLKARGLKDSADYLSMERRGELRTFEGRVVPVAAFLADVADDLDGHRVADAAADSYKDSEAKDFLDRADINWPIQFRRVGAGKSGGEDVRRFQRLIQTGRVQMAANLSLTTAISKATVRRDSNGNPGICRATSRARIDVLSAVVIACGLAEPHFDRPVRARQYGF